MIWMYSARFFMLQLYRKGMLGWGIKYHPRTQWTGKHVYIDLGRVEIRIGG